MIFKNRTSVVSFTILIFLMSLFVATSCFAGRSIIKPYVETGYQRDTNFHKSNDNTKTVDTFNTKGGVVLGYTTEKSQVLLDYYFNIFRFDDQDDVAPGQIKADSFNFTAHRANFTSQAQITDRMLIGLDNMFWRTRDPANADDTSNGVERFKYDMNQFTPRVAYKFGEKFGFGLKYKNLLLDYKDDGPGEGEDSTENRVTFVLSYYFNSKTFFDLDYQIWATDYDKQSVDYTANQAMGRINYQFNYITLAAGAGYQKRSFDNSGVTDFNKFVWQLSASGEKPSETAGIPKHSVYMAFGSKPNANGAGNSYYDSLRLDFRFSYLFIEKINCTLDGYYQNSDYETSTRRDDRYYVSLAADYLISDWFSLGLQGGTEDRNSNIDTKDFSNRFIMINAKFNYNLGAK